MASRQTAKASQLDFPIIADETREIANLLGMMVAWLGFVETSKAHGHPPPPPKPWQDPLEIDDFSKLSMPARALFLIGREGGRPGVLAPASGAF